MLPMARLHNIDDCVTQVITDGIPGDLIETCVRRGGATILMRALLNVFNGRPERCGSPTRSRGCRNRPLTIPDRGEVPRWPGHEGVRPFRGAVDLVKRNFQAFGLLDEQVQFLPGRFKDTLNTAPIGRLAVMRLDGDYDSSTMDALTALYDKLSVGGFVIIDDDGEDRWTDCRKAVHEFRHSRGIADPLVQVDLRCSYWRRTSRAAAPLDTNHQPRNRTALTSDVLSRARKASSISGCSVARQSLSWESVLFPRFFQVHWSRPPRCRRSCVARSTAWQGHLELTCLPRRNAWCGQAMCFIVPLGPTGATGL